MVRRVGPRGIAVISVLALAIGLLAGCETDLLKEVKSRVDEYQASLNKLPAPTGFSADTSAVVTIGLSWNPVSGATGYTLSRGEAADGPFMEIYSGTGTTYTDSTGLSEGVLYYYKVTANNANGPGNPATLSVLYDTTIPVVAISSPLNGSATADATPTISGTASDTNGIASVEVSIDGGSYATATGTTTWSYMAPTLAEGSHSIMARATDGVGKTNTASISITIDTSVPGVTISSPTNGAVVIDNTPTVSGSASDPGGSGVKVVKVQVDGGAFTDATGSESWSFTTSTLVDGSHTLTAQAIDFADNVSSTSSVTITVDATPPAVAISSPADGAVTVATTVSLSGTSSDARGIQKVEVQVDSGSFAAATGTTSWSYTTGVLALGTHTLTARATDNSGNTNTASISVTILGIPGSVSATDGTYDDKTRVSWSSVPGGVTYYIYRSTASGGPYSNIGNTTSIYYDDTTGLPLTYYYYEVQAYKGGVYSGYSAYAYGKRNGVFVYITQWGGLGTGNGQFSRPHGIAIDSSDYVYVTDGNNHRIQKFNSSGVYQGHWGSSGTGNGQFNTPMGIAYDGTYLYVADWLNDRVQKFSTSGAWQATWGSSGSGNGQFNYANSIAYYGGYFYITDEFNYRVQKLDSSGNYVSQFGSQGTGNGQFYYPRGIAVGGSNIYVVDTNPNTRVQKFLLSNFGYVTQWAAEISAIGTLYNGGYVYVTDSLGFHKYNPFTLGLINELKNYGTGNGQFRGAEGIAIDSSGYIYVVDSSNHRVQKFQLQ